MRNYRFDKETVLRLCKKNDVKVVENGTGQFLVDGKSIDPIEKLKKELEFDRKIKEMQNKSRVKKPICERCFYDVIPRRDLQCICLTKNVDVCPQCGLKDRLVVDCRFHGEKIEPDSLVMQSGLSWREIKW